mgnify:CR=1 FL=1
MLTKKEMQLSKTISYALRHKPQEFGLVLDDEGFVELDRLISQLGNRGYSEVTEEILLSLLDRSDKRRWEITDGKIRAVYGHSTKEKIKKEPTTPPEFLYHGTAHRFLSSILEEGLRPKGRQYVHLSQDVDTAVIVGKRRDSQPVILRVRALQACQEGVRFYQELEGIWLSDGIESKYLQVMD